MNVRQLRYFVGVLESKSLSKASDFLHVAQPALGVQIRKLERELGVKLLHRHPRGVSPTEAGQRLAQHAATLLQQFDRVRQDLIDYMTTPCGHVVLCIGRTVPRNVATAIVERCRRTFPDIELTTIENRWLEDVNRKPARSKGDLLVTFQPEHDLQSVAEPLIEEELVLVCSAEEQRLPCEIQFHKVLERSLILRSKLHNLRRLIETAAGQIGHETKVFCEVESLETIKELVARGVADSILPLACVYDEVKRGNLKTAKIRDQKLRRILYILHSSSQSRSSATDLIRREIRETIFEFADDPGFGWKKMRATI